MRTAQLVVSLVRALAWPMVILVIAVIFRVHLRRLLSGQLRRLKAGPIEAEFDRIAAKVQPTLPLRPILESTEALQGAEQLAETSPIAAIIEAHDRIEATLREALVAVGDTVSEADSALRLAERAEALGLILPQSVAAVEGMTVLRNLAVHDPSGQVAIDRVQQFLVLAESTLYAINANLRRATAFSPGATPAAAG